jgi:hypothetical protein
VLLLLLLVPLVPLPLLAWARLQLLRVHLVLRQQQLLAPLVPPPLLAWARLQLLGFHLVLRQQQLLPLLPPLLAWVHLQLLGVHLVLHQQQLLPPLVPLLLCRLLLAWAHLQLQAVHPLLNHRPPPLLPPPLHRLGRHQVRWPLLQVGLEAVPAGTNIGTCTQCPISLQPIGDVKGLAGEMAGSKEH